jgi:hypothetical protein
MKASKFSEAQKAFILKQGNDGMPMASVVTAAHTYVRLSLIRYFNLGICRCFTATRSFPKASCCRRNGPIWRYRQDVPIR